MINELLFMQLASDQQKKQEHDLPQFPCSAYYTGWRCFYQTKNRQRFSTTSKQHMQVVRMRKWVMNMM